VDRLKSNASVDEVCGALDREGYAIVENLLERDSRRRCPRAPP
jgi:hypothetical protein